MLKTVMSSEIKVPRLKPTYCMYFVINTMTKVRLLYRAVVGTESRWLGFHRLVEESGAPDWFSQSST